MTGIERLRKLSEDMLDLSLWARLATGTEKDWDCCKGDGRTLNDELLSIADQIEREADVETVRSDAMEAWEWVREHGGLDHVKAEWRSRVPFDKHDKRRRRLLGHIAECETALGRRNVRIEKLGKTIEFFQLNNSNFRHLLADVAERLGFTRFGNDYEPEDLLDALDRRLMPKGMEWMLWDDGKPVTYDDAPDDVIGVYLALDGSGYALMTDLPYQLMSEPSERVKRPAVLAADGEPLEVGQTVWNVNSGTEFTVVGLPKSGEYQAVKLRLDDGAFTGLDPDQLTHQRPVLDADGVPIKVGDTVYLLPGEWCDEFPCLGFHGGEELEVFDDEEAVHVSGGVQCREKEKKVGFRGYCYPQPSQLTHIKPEPPDSLERIADEIDRLREDVAQYLGDYLYDEDGNDSIQFSMELVAKRCRALAERERGE